MTYDRNYNYSFEDVAPFTFPLLYSEVEGEKSDFCADVYPEDEDFDWSPYPFSLWHSVFVEINPRRNKYTWETINQITVEELRESKNLIRADWAAGIVEIFAAALNWFESDKFDKSRCYNWSLDGANNKYCIEKFDAAKSGDFVKFCENYDLPVEDYPTWKDFALAYSNKSRRDYINNCKKIIEAFV